MLRTVRILAWIVTFFLLLGPAQTEAQAPDVVPVAVFDTDSSDHGATLGLDVFFVLRDASGRPMPDANIESALLRVLDDPTARAALQSVAEADTPLYVAMLLDTSGSMEGALPAVLNAAQQAVDQAPANAQIAITRFSDQAQQVQGFSGDHGQVRAALGGIAEPLGNTCLYDTIYAALEDLNRVAPAGEESARKVVIVFTDGQDLRILADDSRPPCSQHTYADVVDRALAYQIPVNTIGMYSRPDDINRDELTRMAEETKAFSAIGAGASIGNLFQTIFSGLNSQYQASFDLLVGAGPRRGLLEVQLANQAESLYSAPFIFVSPREFAAPVEPTSEPLPTPEPLPVAEAAVNGIIFNPERNEYEIALSIANPDIIDQLIFTVEGDNGLIAYEQRFALNGQPTLSVRIDSAELEEGREYLILIKGVDANNVCIPRPPDPNRLDERPDCVLGQKTFTHERPKLAPVEAVILPVVAQAASKVIVIPLKLTREETVEQFSVTVVDADTGQEIGKFGPDVYEVGKPLTVPMPPSMLASAGSAGGEPKRYQVSVVLKTEDEQTVTTEPYTFVVEYPPPLAWYERLFGALEENPLILGVIALILLLLSLYFTLGSRKEKPAFRLAGSQVAEYTVIGAPAAGPAEKHALLAIKVTLTPQPTDRRSYTIREFPCTIGRSSSCSIRFAGDRQISRTHVSIALEDGEFKVSDLGSDNGAWLDGRRLAPHLATKLRDFQTLRLGSNTTLEIRIQY